MKMKLKELLNGIEYQIDGILPDVNINKIVNDSRKATPDSLFIAYSSYSEDVHLFIKNAYENGCNYFVVLKEKVTEINLKEAFFIYVKDIKSALSAIARKFYNNPTLRMKVIGITGTSGKTTTTFVIYNALRWLDKKVGLIGTIEYRINDKIFPSSNTTPDLLDLYEIIDKMKKEGIEYLVMEVSSHSLYLGRVDGINFDICGFTNFSQDHLDFHKTMEEYLEAKLLIFNKLSSSEKEKKVLLVNKDMEVFPKVKKRSIEFKNIPLKTLSLYDDKADYFIKILRSTTSKTVFELNGKKIEIGMPGITNIYNFAFAASVLIELGFDTKDFSTPFLYTYVKGRMEKIPNNLGISIIIDYAHKPDALEKLLKTVKPLIGYNGKLITVFGCGGDRDKLKRPIMGKISGEISDYTIITSDNPRTENPDEIIKQIEEGIKSITDKYEIIQDRREAIKRAILMAKINDCVVIAGKGHEDYQIIGKEKYHFSDREEALKVINSIKQKERDFPKTATENLINAIKFSINYTEKLNEKWLILENIIQLIRDLYMLKNKENLHRSVVEFLIDYQPLFNIPDIKLVSKIEKGLRTKREFYKLEKEIELNETKILLSKIKILMEKITNEINSSNK